MALGRCWLRERRVQALRAGLFRDIVTAVPARQRWRCFARAAAQRARREGQHGFLRLFFFLFFVFGDEDGLVSTATAQCGYTPRPFSEQPPHRPRLRLGVVASLTSTTGRNSFSSEVNSNSVNKARKASTSGAPAPSPRFRSTGTLQSMVASCLLRRTLSRLFCRIRDRFSSRPRRRDPVPARPSRSV